MPVATETDLAELMRRLLAYRYPNGDFSHKHGCDYNLSLDVSDCTCGLVDLNDAIDRWTMEVLRDEKD